MHASPPVRRQKGNEHWLFDSRSTGAAFVGSSNLTRSALANGVEWNLRVERSIDPLAYDCVRAAVDALWATAGI
jgi:HKD family nuclease